MSPRVSTREKAVTRNDNKINPKDPIKYEPTFKPKPKRKTARRSKTTVGLDSHPKLGCVTAELIKALNHMALGFTLVSDWKVIKEFFRYHRYQLRQESDFEATEL